MKNITNLTPKIIEDLNNIIKNDTTFRTRKRAEAILLSYKGNTCQANYKSEQVKA